MCKFVDDHKDIRLAIAQSIRELEAHNEFVGWISALDVETLAPSSSGLRGLPPVAQSDYVEPSFDEADEVREARRLASRFSTSDLPLLITGEPGTGRRTLAAALTRQRVDQSGGAVLMLDGVEGITDRFRTRLRTAGQTPTEVLVHHVEALPQLQQRELAGLIHSKQIRVVAVGRLDPPPADGGPKDTAPRAPELSAEVESTTLVLPALRDRGNDVVNWARFFLARGAQRLDVPVPSFAPSALNAITGHRWPGNLIELDAAC
jgi:hypothetical protein